MAYNDPHVPVAVSHRKDFRMRSTQLTEKNLERCDCVLIATDHSSYDFGWIVKNSSLKA